MEQYSNFLFLSPCLKLFSINHFQFLEMHFRKIGSYKIWWWIVFLVNILYNFSLPKVHFELELASEVMWWV